jgi:hypothetical protein
MAFGFRTKKRLEASRSRSPDVKKDNSRTDSPNSVVKDYGYGDACPDSEKKQYGESADSSSQTRPSRTPRRSSVKGGSTAARERGGTTTITANDYGYGDACPDSESRPARTTPRRSSMKQGNSGSIRRSSIGFTGEMAVTLPGKKKPVRRRTSIAFAEEAEVRVVKPIATLTDEPETLWFQEEELCNIKDRLRAVVHTVENGELNSKVCIRGLEGHIGGSTRIKVRAAWDAVKGEQTMQKIEGKFNEGGISSMYKLFTKESANQAAERAQQDAADIDKYQRDTRRMMRRLSC